MADYRVKSTYQSTSSDSTDKFLLAAAFVVGIAGSLTLKLYHFDVWVPAAFSAAVILIYALLAYFLPRVQLESDQVGDNAYYLGFVLTLTSLSFTLYELSGNDAKVEFIAQVIAGFGIALSSTIVGVAVRVMFLQFRMDLVARDREARLTLNDAMRQFRAELADTIRGIKYLGVEIRQSLNEHHAELAKSNAFAAQSLHDEMLASFKGALKPVGAQLIKMTNEVTENATLAVSSSEISRTKAQADLATAIDASSSAVKDETSRMLATVKEALQTTTAQILEFSRQVETQVAEVSRTLSSLSQTAVAQLEGTANAVAKNSENLANTSLKAIESSTASFIGSITKVTTSVDPAAAALEKSVADLSLKLGGLVAELQSRADALRVLASQAQIDQREVAGSLSNVTSAIELYTKQLQSHQNANSEIQRQILDQIGRLQASLASRADVPQTL
ncbi:hypothetical protein [Paragemmobacter straminiformis]|uniref:Uncharacterized protein n=1 Tax=Paragemmobacter straminiformis TaxID=2045119 RepID=A0A842I096_9RHOB|nr:hypothetical protein [Gemmobacter straminiformis]MBC2834082.1 hypothetical protein [Gemmobacter straminiformis]